MNNPIYKIEIKAIFCNIELWLNDILIFCHYEENGSLWVDWPINHFLLQTGVQNFEVRLYPYNGETFFSERTELEVGVHCTDNSDDEHRVEVLDLKSVDLKSPEELPIFIYRKSFVSNIPFKLEGWSESLDLSKENEEELIAELFNWKKVILNVLVTSNLEKYNAIFKTKESEFDQANYTNYIENDHNVFHSKFKLLVDIPDESYHIEFYADNRIVSLKLPEKLPGFTFEPKEINEESLGLSQIVYFHRRKKGAKLEIIR